MKNLIKIFYLPPPNITGRLHIGHALNFIISDVIIRNYNNIGFKTLWIPGLDHAGIATQNVIKNFFNKHGIIKKIKKRFFLIFYKKWRKKYSKIITKQIKKINIKINWKFKYFTLNNKISKIVKKIFIRLYKKNLIIKKKHLINWDFILNSAISDIEIKYFISLKNKINILHPFINKKGYIINNELINRILFNKLFIIKNIIFYKKKTINLNNNNKIPLLINNNNYSNVLFFLKHLIKINLKKNKIKEFYIYKKYKIIKIIIKKKILITKSEKTNSIIKYKLKNQWFILMSKKIKNLKKKYFSFKKSILNILKKKYIKIIPKKWIKIFLNWVLKIKDWCISRQLWIGHKIPIYYIKKKIIIINNFKKIIIYNKYKKKIKKEKNVLDTWFSSALIPIISKFLIKKKFNFNFFIKSEILITGYDIIFFWVIRMIMFSLFFFKKTPFKIIYIHGLIVDEKGKKMSKSIGNIINPDDFIKKKSNIDIFRLLLTSLNNKNKNILFQESLLKQYELFYYKIINVNNFIINKSILYLNFFYLNYINKNNLKKNIINKWINSIIEENKIIIQNNYKKIKINNNIKIIYKLIKKIYSNYYIEINKSILNNKSLNIKYCICNNMLYSFLEIIKIIYPIIPNLSKKLLNNLYNLLNKNNINLDYKKFKFNFNFKLNLNLINLDIKILFVKYFKIFNEIKNKRIKYLIIYTNNFKILNIKNIFYKFKKNIITNKKYIKIF